MKKYILSFFVFILLTFNLIGQYNEKVHPLVKATISEKELSDCIILLKNQADLSESKYLNSKTEKGRLAYHKLVSAASSSQKNVLEILRTNTFTYQSFFVVNAVRAIIDEKTLKLISELSEVAVILPNVEIKSDFPVSNDEIASKTLPLAEWGLYSINAHRLWELGIKGQGVTVAGQDTGYDWQHPAIINQYRGYSSSGSADHNYNWHDAIHGMHPLNTDTLNPCGFNALAPCDDGSHGTHTVGTMVGDDGNGNAIGVAPSAKWIGCRNMERGWGLPSTYIECFEWFLAPTDLNSGNPNTDLSPHVINNSWSCPTEEGCNPSNFEAMRIAVKNLRDAGIVVVVSAGNSGPACSSVNTPAAMFEESFSVGAIRVDDTLANFSSRGPVTIDSSYRIKPNVVAPGVSVRSSVPGANYSSSSGTSMAGPHVAGAVALLISAAPELAGKVDLIEEILEQTAQPLFHSQECGGLNGNDRPNNTVGWGKIDLWKALSVVRPDLFNENLSASELNVFPNPSNGQFVLISPEEMGSCRVVLNNHLGQKIAEKKLDFLRIHPMDFVGIPNGLYILTIIPDKDPKNFYTTQIRIK
jgi:subtilisin family serine protease